MSPRPRRLALVGAIAALVSVATLGPVQGQGVGVGPGGGTPGTAQNFELVGHNDLSGFELDGNTTPRGMNAALANFDDFIYIGNRADGSDSCGDSDPGPGVVPVLTPTNPDGTCTHPHPGILVVDVGDPASPTVVGEFGTEFVSGSNIGQTARELRVWPAEELLMVMYFRCSRVIHVCPQTAQSFRIRFFDLGVNPVDPPLVATYTPSQLPHEMYLWIDPKNPSRALLWISTPTSSVNPNTPNLIITDISRAREGTFTEIAAGNWNQFFPGAENPANYDFDLALHSMTPSFDGKDAPRVPPRGLRDPGHYQGGQRPAAGRWSRESER